jgi:8-oxo-dGTP diphosphatase
VARRNPVLKSLEIATLLLSSVILAESMSPTHVNHETIEGREQRLDDEYGIDYREDATVTVDSEQFPREVELSRDGYIGSSYVWIVRSPEQADPLTESMPDHIETNEDRVLMILGRGGHEWGIPGGGQEGEETFEAGAIREVREETSIDCRITDLFGVRHERRTNPDYDEVLHNLRVVFEGRYEDGHISIQPGELSGAAWMARRPRAVHPLAAPVAEDWFEE